MPLVQYYTMDGTFITQETASSVSPDGTSMQISGFSISQLPVGAYAAFVSNAASGGTYSFLGTGAVQVYTGPASAKASVTINGSEDCASGACDQGTVHITVNGFTATVSYGSSSSGSSIASALVSILNGSSSPVVATASGATVNMTAKTTGFSSCYPLSAGSTSGAPFHLAKPSFLPSPSNNYLVGGH